MAHSIKPPCDQPLRLVWTVLLVLIGALGAIAARAGEPALRIAVAANFKQTLDRLGAEFAKQSGELAPVVSSGATGLLYGQIVQGAPFDLFFAADRERPEALEKNGLAVPGSRFTYAVGKLVLWRPGRPWRGTLEEALAANDVRVLSIANPAVAPYGLAAQQVLEKLKLWAAPRFKVVQGESLGQAFQFIATGNAQLGFVSLAQVLESGNPAVREEILEVDAGLYDPIQQDVVLLKRAGNPAAQRFLEYVRSPAGRAIIAQAGYAHDQ